MTHENDQDRAIILLTICVLLLTVQQILQDYQLDMLIDAIQRGNDEQTVEPIR